MDYKYSLHWNDFAGSLISALGILRDDEEFVDVTVACGSKSFKAHKVVLAASSPYFKTILKENPCQHPVIIIRDVHHIELNYLLQYIYHGTTEVEKSRLGRFLKAAEDLQVKGISGNFSVKGDEFDDSCIEEYTKSKLDGQENDELTDVCGGLSTTPPLKKHKQKNLKSKRFEGLPPLVPINNPMAFNHYNGNATIRDKSDAFGELNIKQEYFDDEMGLNDGIYIEETLIPSSSYGNSIEGNDNVSEASQYSQHTQQTSQDSIPLGANVGSVAGNSSDNEQSADQPRKLAFHEPRPCPVCRRVYRDAATLRTHTAIMHVDGQTPFYCSCGAPFRTKYEMYMHKKNGHR